MKSKWLFIITALALSLCFSLAACQDSDSSNEKSPDSTENTTPHQETPAAPNSTEQTPQDVTVGTILDKPEKMLELEEFYVSVTYPYTESEAGVKTLEIALKDKDEPGILYMSDGMLKIHENIYELSKNGNVVKYTKDAFAETFTQDQESSAETLKNEVETLKALLQKVGYGFTELSSDIKYKKCEDVKILLTGEAFKYEIYGNGELFGTICVDKQTGIFVKMTNPDGSDVMTVTSLKTSEFDIPEYK